MRVLLAIPPYYRLFGSYNNRINLGLHTLAQILHKKSIPVKILNLDHKNQGPLLCRPGIFTKSKHPASEEKLLAENEFCRAIEEFGPSHLIMAFGDPVVPSTDFGSPQIAMDLFLKIKSKYPYIFSVAYGPLVIENPHFDLTLCGHAESAILFFLEQNRKGFHYISTDNKALEEIPFLTLDNLCQPIETRDFDYIWQSRGCCFNCSFCLLPVVSKKINFRSPKKFVEEIFFRHQKYQVKNFYFTDSVFNFSNENLKNVCDQLANLALPIEWRCDCRIDLIDDEQIKYFRKGRVNFVKLGIESMNDQRLRFLGKKFNVSLIQEKMKLLKKEKVKTVVYILLGHPGYSDEEYLQELKLFKSLKADKYTVSILNPAPNSKLYHELNWNSGFCPASHLNSGISEYWHLSEKVLKQFFQLELEHGREDEPIRKYDHDFEFERINSDQRPKERPKQSPGIYE